MEPFTYKHRVGEDATAWITVNQRDGDASLYVAEVLLQSDSAKGLTSDMLREVRFSEAYEAARDHDPNFDRDHLLTIGRRSRLERQRARKQGGRWSTVEDEQLALYAEMYLDALRGGSRNPVQTMARRMGRAVNIATIRDRLKACREFDWLMDVRQGRAGAVAGPALLHYRRHPKLDEAKETEDAQG